MVIWKEEAGMLALYTVEYYVIVAFWDSALQGRIVDSIKNENQAFF